MAASKIRDRIKRWLSHDFVGNVSVLVRGTVFAQLISVAVLPILTRIYGPGDFAVLAVYATILGLFSSVACLRFEIAIPIAKSDKDAAKLFLLALLSVAVFTLAAFVVALFAGNLFIGLIKRPDVQPYLLLVPVGILTSGCFTALQYWATRSKYFEVIARTRVMQSAGGVATQVGLGAAGLVPAGLIVGQIVNSGAGSVRLWRRISGELRPLLKGVSVSSLKVTLADYRRFPTYSTLESFFNSAGVEIPVLIIAAVVAGPEIGFLILATKVLSVPTRLLGRGISQVYLSEAPQAFRESRLTEFTRQVFGGLLKAGIPPLIFLACLSPILFPVVFGSEWQRAGVLVAWMTPWFVLQFLSSSLSMILHVTGRQRTAFALQVFGFLLRGGVVLAAGIAFHTYAVEFYALVSAVFYLVYLAVVISAAQISIAEVYMTLKQSFGYIICSLLLAAVLSLGLSCLVN